MIAKNLDTLFIPEDWDHMLSENVVQMQKQCGGTDKLQWNASDHQVGIRLLLLKSHARKQKSTRT